MSEKEIPCYTCEWFKPKKKNPKEGKCKFVKEKDRKILISSGTWECPEYRVAVSRKIPKK